MLSLFFFLLPQAEMSMPPAIMMSMPPKAITEVKKEVSQRHQLIAQALADRRKREKEEEEVERGKRPSPALCWDGPEDFEASEKDSEEEEEARKLVPLEANKKVPDNAGDAPQK